MAERCLFDKPSESPRTCALNVLPEGESVPQFCASCSHFAPYKHEQFLGDRLALLFKKPGVERAVKRVFGKSCGCAKRQNQLNRLHRRLMRR